MHAQCMLTDILLICWFVFLRKKHIVRVVSKKCEGVSLQLIYSIWNNNSKPLSTIKSTN